MRWTGALLLMVLLGGCDDEPKALPAATKTAAATASTPAAPTGQASATASATATAAVPSRPLYYERPIEAADLQGRSLRELALMRNTIYARAGNPFRRKWLRDHFTAQPWYEPGEETDESKLTDLDRDNAKRIGEHDASLSREDLLKTRKAIEARMQAGVTTAEDRVELSLLSQRLGEWIGPPDPDASPLEDHRLLDEVISLAQLENMSRRDLRILRNTIYARKGRRFESKVVQGYFETALWYEPGDFHEGMLTSVDHKNIQLIRSVEDELGGPLHENPNFGKDGWFVMA